MEFLDPTALAELGALTLKARNIVEGALTGAHKARLHGSSVEFSEHKEYSRGDEIRHIDWKAYAKNDRYYVKQFEQESELTAYLVLDASGSMAYRGDRLSKLEYASFLCASLAYLLLSQQDRVGLLVFGDPELDRWIPPRGRPTHLHDLHSLIVDVHRRGASGEESASSALERVADLSRQRRGMVIVVSDMFEQNQSALATLKRLSAQRHDVVLFHTLDPDELELPFRGLTRFRALEGSRELVANPDAIRRMYRERLDEFLRRVHGECVNSGIDYHAAPTSRPIERALLDFVIQRARGADAAPRESRWSL